MNTGADHLHFSQQIWQTVSDHARRCLLRREFSPEHSRIENLRCVHFEEELDSNYGRQLWYFEAIGVDPIGRRHMLYGALEFSIQYGLLEPSQAALFEDADHRQRFLYAAIQPIQSQVWKYAATRFWVRMVAIGVVVVTTIWIGMLVSYLRTPDKSKGLDKSKGVAEQSVHQESQAIISLDGKGTSS